MLVALIIFIFFLCWTYVLYPLFLCTLKKNHSNSSRKNYAPTVSIVIVAHNEEKVIEKTIVSCISQDYKLNDIEIVVASDHSTDDTVKIANKYADQGVRVVQTKDRKGRANAHNEACDTISSDIIAFCDANTIWEKDTLSHLVDSLSDNNTGYVTGKLNYINTNDNKTSHSEGLYWKYELFLRKLESATGSITAGNGAVYAIKRECYEPINPLYSHDIVLPSMVVKKGLRSVYNPLAIAYERAGETTNDEYSRKVRMFGRAWHFMFNSLSVFNPIKVGFKYSVFMFSHRFLRYSAGLLQLLVLISTILTFFLEPDSHGYFLYSLILLQIAFYSVVFLGSKMFLGRFGYQLYYFNLFHVATLVGLYNALTNKIKPFWLSPQSTRK